MPRMPERSSIAVTMTAVVSPSRTCGGSNCTAITAGGVVSVLGSFSTGRSRGVSGVGGCRCGCCGCGCAEALLPPKKFLIGCRILAMVDCGCDGGLEAAMLWRADGAAAPEVAEGPPPAFDGGGALRSSRNFCARGVIGDEEDEAPAALAPPTSRIVPVVACAPSPSATTSGDDPRRDDAVGPLIVDETSPPPI